VGLAQELDSPLVRVVIDKAGYEPSWEEARTSLSALEAVYGGSGVKLAVENHDRFSSPSLLKLIQGMEDWCGICLDTANSLGSLESPSDTLRILGEASLTLHAKDVVIRRVGHQMGFVVGGAAAGAGMVPMEDLRALAQRKSLDVLVEQWPPHGDDSPETEQALVRQGLDWFKSR
jgi:sugar phosphate isomerase/epimerase